MGSTKPVKCPVCGADSEKLISYQIPGIRGEKTPKNLKAGFIAESQASVRNRAFAMMADQEGFSQVAKLFRAVAEAESVHAFNHLQSMGAVSDTQVNLESAFERENLAANAYPQLIRDAIEEGNEDTARIFGFVRDVEKEHSQLYRKALDRMTSETQTDYYICTVCGHISDGELPENCPICGAPASKFRKVT
jgi:rubrerythrin